MQEDSEKTGKVTSAGMYFLHFQVYRLDSTVNAVSKCIIHTCVQERIVSKLSCHFLWL